MPTSTIFNPQWDDSVACTPSSGLNHFVIVSDSSDYTYNYLMGNSVAQDVLSILDNPIPSGAVIDSVNLVFRCETQIGGGGAEYAKPFVKFPSSPEQDIIWGTNHGPGTSKATFTDTGIARPGGGSWTRLDFDSLLIGYKLHGGYHPDGGEKDPPYDTWSRAYKVYLEVFWSVTGATNIYPQSDNSVACSPSSGTDHALLVRDLSYTTYNYRAGSGSAVWDVLNINNPIPLGAVIDSVNLKFRCATEIGGGGVESAQPFVKFPTSEPTWGTNHGPGTSINWYTDTGIVRPGTGSWTRSDFDSLLIGYKLQGGYHPDGGDKDPPYDTYSFAYDVYLEVSWTASDIGESGDYYSFGVVNPSTGYPTGYTAFTITNNSNFPVKIMISGTNMTGGDGWPLANDGNPDATHVALKAGLEGDSDYATVVKLGAPYNYLIGPQASVASLAAHGQQGDSKRWGLKLFTPTATFSDQENKTGYITLTGIAA